MSSLSNPKSYSSWKGKEYSEPDLRKLNDGSESGSGPKGTAAKDLIHGPKPKDMGDADEVNNPTQGEQRSIKSGWPSSKEYKR